MLKTNVILFLEHRVQQMPFLLPNISITALNKIKIFT